ncbi:hypothetical protein E4U50_007640 [Claviceps purpurea]|nr:hypothetical protein E4U50_007640 [Claviceps purpurea]
MGYSERADFKVDCLTPFEQPCYSDIEHLSIRVVVSPDIENSRAHGSTPSVKSLLFEKGSSNRGYSL